MLKRDIPRRSVVVSGCCQLRWSDPTTPTEFRLLLNTKCNSAAGLISTMWYSYLALSVRFYAITVCVCGHHYDWSSGLCRSHFLSIPLINNDLLNALRDIRVWLVMLWLLLDRIPCVMHDHGSTQIFVMGGGLSRKIGTAVRWIEYTLSFFIITICEISRLF